MPNDTDLTQFLAAGLNGYNFAVIMDLEAYHRPADNWQNLDRRSLAHYGSYATALAARLAQADLDALASSQDAVFFPLFWGMLVVYPESWAVPLAAGACILYVIGMMRALVRRRLKIIHVMLGMVFAISIPLLVAFIAYLGLKVLKASLNHAGYAAMICSLAPGCILFSPTIFLTYHALTIGLLPVLAGLASQAIFLIHINCVRPQNPN